MIDAHRGRGAQAGFVIVLLLLGACHSEEEAPWSTPLEVTDTGAGTTAGDTDSDPGDPEDTGPPPDTGTADTGTADTAEPVDPVDVPEEEGCENLNPRFCAFPWPSDRYLEEDDTTVTGYRLAYTEAFLPDSVDADSFDFSPFERLDGTTPAPQIMTLPPAPLDLSEAASQDDIDRSLASDSPTVILDLETGERIAHWVELDARADSEEQKVLYLRLASRLEEDRAYGVALRDLCDEEGEPWEPSEWFQALRDGTPTTSEDLESRRDGYETLFDALDAAGVERETLVEAWWFHTASGESIRGDMLHIREDALERLGDQGLGCTVESVEDDYGGDGLTWRRLDGTFTVPSYMDSATPPARFVRGDDDLPQYVEDVEVDFTLIVPTSLVEGEDGPVAGPLVTFGHGLMGSASSYLGWSDIREIAYENAVVMVGTDWAGMSEADIATVATALYDVSAFVYVAERLQQGMVNQMALTRTFLGACSELEELVYDGTNLIDPTRPYFVGASQGGILGGTLLTLSPDIERGVLLVNGVVFPFMMERSIDYEPYLPYFEAAHPDRFAQALLLPLSQHLWDHAEPSGYLPHLADGLEDIGPKQVLSIAARNDAQVPNLSTDQAMRMVDVPVIEGSAREPWGFDVESAPWEGSGYITVDMGDPEVPEGNVFPEDDAGGHYAVCIEDSSLEIMQTFLEEGTITMPCDGVCDPD